MNTKLHLKAPIYYEITNSNYVCLKTPRGNHISNMTGKQILDFLCEGGDLDMIVKRYQQANNIDFYVAAIDVCEYLSGLKLLGLLDYDDSYFDSVLLSNKFSVAGEREYQKISDSIIDRLDKESTIFSSYPDKSSYDAYLLRSKGFGHQELYFFTNKNQCVQSIIGVANVSEKNVPVNIVLVQTENNSDLIDLFYYIERELIRLNKHKIRAVFSTTSNERFCAFLKSVGFFLEGELIKEDKKNNYYVYSKLIMED